MDGRHNPYLKFWQLTVIGAPAWWFLGLNLGIYHMAALLLFWGMVHYSMVNHKGIYLPPSVVFLTIILTIYLVSMIVNAPVARALRLLASSYNFTFWIMGFFLVISLANLFSLEDLHSFFRTFVYLAWPTALLTAVIFLLAWRGVHSISFDTPLYGFTRFLGHTTLVENSLSVKMLYWEWFSSRMFPRLNLFSPYAVGSAEIVLIILIMVTRYLALSGNGRNPVLLFLWLALLGSILMTLSRMPVIAFASGYVVLFLIRKRQPFFWIACFVVALFFVYPWLDRLLSFILQMREGSNVGRLELYKYSLERLQGVEWILGLGVKPRDHSFFLVPIGSHSTYLSLIFRTGITGLLFFLGLQGYLFWQWFALKPRVVHHRDRFVLWQAFGWIFVAMAMCMITDEIDVTQLLAFLYFSVIGYFEAFRKGVLA